MKKADENVFIIEKCSNCGNIIREEYNQRGNHKPCSVCKLNKWVKVALLEKGKALDKVIKLNWGWRLAYVLILMASVNTGFIFLQNSDTWVFNPIMGLSCLLVLSTSFFFSLNVLSEQLDLDWNEKDRRRKKRREKKFKELKDMCAEVLNERNK